MDVASQRSTLKPLVKPATLQKQIFEALQSAIMSGEMRSGMTYSAPSLAERFGVSATSVREALRELVREGIMEILPNSGYRVREHTDDKLDDVIELRLLIEVPIMVKLAAEVNDETAKAVEALREVAVEMNRAAADGDVVTYMHLDTEFHCDLAAIHGNDEITESIRRLRHRSRLHSLPDIAREGKLLESATEHEELLNIILVGDHEKMADFMRAHIVNAKHQR